MCSGRGSREEHDSFALLGRLQAAQRCQSRIVSVSATQGACVRACFKVFKTCTEVSTGLARFVATCSKPRVYLPVREAWPLDTGSHQQAKPP